MKKEITFTIKDEKGNTLKQFFSETPEAVLPEFHQWIEENYLPHERNIVIKVAGKNHIEVTIFRDKSLIKKRNN